MRVKDVDKKNIYNNKTTMSKDLKNTQNLETCTIHMSDTLH